GVVGDVAPDQAACIAEPRRPFAPAHAGREPLDTGVEEAVSVEARIEAFDSWIGIALTRLPATECIARKCHRGGSARRPEHVASGPLHRMSPGLSATTAMIVDDLTVTTPANQMAHASCLPTRAPPVAMH